MSNVTSFSNSLATRLESTQRVRLNLIPLIVPAVIQILSDMLGRCGGGEEAAMKLLQDPTDWRTQRAVRLAVVKADREEGLGLSGEEKRTCRQEVLAACSECDPAFLERGIQEIDQANKQLGFEHMLI